jgi:hypothetical protein
MVLKLAIEQYRTIFNKIAAFTKAMENCTLNEYLTETH